MVRPPPFSMTLHQGQLLLAVLCPLYPFLSCLTFPVRRRGRELTRRDQCCHLPSLLREAGSAGLQFPFQEQLVLPEELEDAVIMEPVGHLPTDLLVMRVMRAREGTHSRSVDVLARRIKMGICNRMGQRRLLTTFPFCFPEYLACFLMINQVTRVDLLFPVCFISAPGGRSLGWGAFLVAGLASL